MPNQLRRVRHKYLPTLLRKPTRDIEGAFCKTCLKPVDSEEMVEGYMTENGHEGQYPYCKVLVKCHGAEELVQLDFDTTEWDERDLKTAMSRVRFFDPMSAALDGKLQA